ncbi:ABC transporter substrate-binding protein [Kutzneria sp. CA-103260]|uniref:ABC transporter substrate-binding protein n=1 Tax=Kutzneria sp. CA-103260 TaxID=2802641 RepID=UPI001BA4C186|nr:extracellular solute-binding protein [Kutzneria sp. CA-103260]QUQ72471.1 sugar-binding protein [Kutzneria sp. CA-103260]
MSRRTRTARAIALVASSALLLVGCGTSTGSSADNTSLTGTVRILANITPALTKQYYQGLVAPFVKSHPGVTVTIESPSGKDVQSTLQQELASGSTPDVVASNLDPVVAPQMTPFPDADWVKATPLADNNKVDGKVWQVATGAQIQSLVFYNQDAFQKAGITVPPASLTDFTADLVKLKAAGYVPLQTAGEWVTGAQFAMMANPALLGKSPDWYLQRNDGKVKFAGSAYETYLKAYADWIAQGLVPKESLGQKYQDSIDSFSGGKSGMYVMGNWLVATVDKTPPSFKVGVFPTPTVDGSAPKQLSGAAQPYSILKASKNQALDLALVQYLVSDKDAVTTSLKSEGNFRSGFSYPGSELNTAVGQILDKSPGAVNGTSGQGVNSGFGNELNTVVQSLYTGQNAAQATAALDSWWDANGDR